MAKVIKVSKDQQTKSTMYRCVKHEPVDLNDTVTTAFKYMLPMTHPESLITLYLRSLVCRRDNGGFHARQCIDYMMALKVPFKSRIITELLYLIDVEPFDHGHGCIGDLMEHATMAVPQLCAVWDILKKYPGDNRTKQLFLSSLKQVNPYIDAFTREHLRSTASCIAAENIIIESHTNATRQSTLFATLSMLFTHFHHYCQNVLYGKHSNIFHKTFKRITKKISAKRTNHEKVYIIDAANVMHTGQGKVTKKSYERLVALQDHLDGTHDGKVFIIVVMHRRWLSFDNNATSMNMKAIQSSLQSRENTVVVSTPFGYDDDVFIILCGLLLAKQSNETYIVTNDKFKQHMMAFHKCTIDQQHFSHWLSSTLVTHQWSRKQKCTLMQPSHDGMIAMMNQFTMHAN